MGLSLDARDSDWSHEAFAKAETAYLAEPSSQSFFAQLITALREAAIGRDRRFKLSLEQLRAWADPSCILPSDDIEPSGPKRAPRARRWSRFQGTTSAPRYGETGLWCTPGAHMENQLKTVERFDSMSRGEADREAASRWSRLSRAVLTAAPLDSNLRTTRALMNTQQGAVLHTETKTGAKTETRPNAHENTEDAYNPQQLMEELYAELVGSK